MELSVAEWLQSRTPPSPENLRQRMIAELDRLGLCDERISSKPLADAGCSILQTLDESGCNDRSAALDLLAADALFTYAFEAAAESKAEIEHATRYVLQGVTKK